MPAALWLSQCLGSRSGLSNGASSLPLTIICLAPAHLNILKIDMIPSRRQAAWLHEAPAPLLKMQATNARLHAQQLQALQQACTLASLPKPMHCAAVAVAAAGFLFFKRRRDSGQASAGSSSSGSTADDEAPQISPSRGPPQLATIAGTQPVSRIS